MALFKKKQGAFVTDNTLMIIFVLLILIVLLVGLVMRFGPALMNKLDILGW
jgi:hypothetical protein